MGFSYVSESRRAFQGVLRVSVVSSGIKEFQVVSRKYHGLSQAFQGSRGSHEGFKGV